MSNKQTVGYSESIESFNPETGLKSWKKIWYSKEIDEDKDPTIAFNETKELVEKWGSGSQITVNPEYAHLLSPVTIPHVQIEKEVKIGVTVEDINSCTDEHNLAIYKWMVKGKPELQEAYDKKLKSFL